MRRLWSHEAYKLAGRRAAWAVLAVLVAANLLFTVWTGYRRLDFTLFTPQDYKTLYAQMEGKSPRDAVDFLENVIAENRDDLYWRGFKLYPTVRDEIAAVLSYDDYLRQIEENARKLGTFGLFSELDSFSYKNAEKTAADYRAMRGITPIMGPNMGVELATEGGFTDFFAVLAIFAMVLLLFTYEKERGLTLLSRTTSSGGARHGLCKLAAVWTGCFVVTAALYVPKLAVGEALFGLGDLSRPLQSVAVGATAALSVGQFVAVCLLSKLLALMALAAVFGLIAAFARRAVHAYVATAAVMGGSYLLGLIPYHGPFSLLSVVQPLAWLQSDALWSEYRNLNLFGTPFSWLIVVYCAILTALITCTAAVAAVCRRADLEERTNPRELRVRNAVGRGRGGLVSHEGYKLLVQNRALFLLIFTAIAAIYACVAMPIREEFADVDEMLYKRLAIAYEGELSSENEELIYTEARESKSATPRLEQRLREHIKYLQTTPNGQFFYDAGYKRLTFSDLRTDLWLLLIGAVALIAALCGLFPLENRTGAIVLLRSAPRGGRSTIRAKLIVSSLTTLFIGVCLYVPFAMGVLSAYGSPALSAPAYSMEHLSFAAGSVGTAVAVCLLLRLAALFVIMGAVLLCSRRAKQSGTALALCTGVVAGPILLAILLAG
ncbi:hypothetical protein FACS189425_08360 [Clostridia bacterium]|nr:hypothetical protein FACS189425_08360 [Clostridia bacterium]